MSILKDEIKIIVIGESGVGKSCLIYHYVNNDTLTNVPSTVGIDFFIKNVVIDNTPMSFKIWDTAGQERFRNVVKSFFRGVDGALLVFDITMKESFNQIPEWINLINQETSSNPSFLLVGNKCDLLDNRQVSIEEAKQLAQTYDIKYFETSAKTGINIDETFTSLGQEIFQNLKAKSKVDETSIKLTNETDKDKKKCC